jgi:hypothetical protein
MALFSNVYYFYADMILCGFAFSLLKKYSAGAVITQALRALAFAVAVDAAPLFTDAAEVVRHVSETEGEIWTWAEGRPTSPYII